jgi:ABC-type multidrug transport system fused ATPase/permease subunit
MTNISETAGGRAVLHAMGLGPFFCGRQVRNIERWCRFSHFSGSSIQWGVWVSSVIGFLLSIAACLVIFLRRSSFADPAVVGVALNYCTIMPYFLSILSIILMLLSNGATCVERVLEYAGEDLPQEPAWFVEGDPVPSKWPVRGALRFEDVRLRYRPGLPLAVDGVSFEVRPGEHVGVVGRTGAGKSSIVGLLFRVVEPTGGRIVLDGRDAGRLGLRTLRRAIAIVTQTPLLLPGTLRHNLDPFDRADEAELRSALLRVGLPPQKLAEGAGELSAGEKQLMALARLLLLDASGGRGHGRSLGVRGPKLVVLDEPTANIDALTDERVQRVIREAFEGVSTLTIAHRLESIIDSDRILVLDAGRVAGYDSAARLLADSNGLFSAMVDAAGPEASKSLRRRAEAAERRRVKGSV